MPNSIRLALYQPDMPQNLGNLLRLAACMATPCELIEPLGFPFDDKRARRSGMDYIDQVALTRHESWDSFLRWKQSQPARLVLLTSKDAIPYTQFHFQPGDLLLLGRESAGVPEEVAMACEARINIPMAAGTRCLNVTSAAAMVLGEALRQTSA